MCRLFSRTLAHCSGYGQRGDGGVGTGLAPTTLVAFPSTFPSQTPSVSVSATISPSLTPSPSPDWLHVVVRNVTAGMTHSCALMSSGDALCWGSNTLGQLGAPQRLLAPLRHRSADDSHHL